METDEEEKEEAAAGWRDNTDANGIHLDICWKKERKKSWCG